MNPTRRQELIDVYRDGLLNDTVPFWMRHGVDHEHGGFLTSLHRDGTVIDTDKGVWQQGRCTWLLAELYNNVEPREEWLQLAIQGAAFLEQNCFDPSDGRMWFHVTQDGRPIRKRRYAFSECFAAIAYGELFLATGQSHYRERAIQTFRRFIDHNLNSEVAASKFTGTRPARSMGFPMMTIVTAQELRQSIGLEDADDWIDRSIATIRDFHLKPDIACVMETVGVNGELLDHFEGRTLNPGHAIEGAWFILWEGHLREDASLIQTGCQMLDWMWHRGWDREHGGILYFVDVHGLPVQEYWHDMKFWWPQNETILATLLAHLLTGDDKYADWHQQAHQWAYARFPDARHGEWFGYLHRDGSISSELKGNLWKGPFHLPRMQYMAWKWLEKDLA
ncbi:AGE family epimerase/isomerase [Rhodopirellula sp. P2]|uniref:AGE family epimerase/isomerase n=1 Tax=Rhodopirellula sp. P2 TaxID=2127060 RepID=UPI002368CB64|nr:AGE family epimerase/isomerase [Rhodopirellula sp. P2]WDQ15077.1 AGE family epimerase/isomerase [Rhodopirellula sp. P2]